MIYADHLTDHALADDLSESVLGKVMAPRGVDVLVSKPCDCAALHGNRDSAGVVQVVDLIMGREAGIIRVGPM